MPPEIHNLGGKGPGMGPFSICFRRRPPRRLFLFRW
nr:MAG TPA: hypothetical protein [Caudoviricetes sp.]